MFKRKYLTSITAIVAIVCLILAGCSQAQTEEAGKQPVENKAVQEENPAPQDQEQKGEPKKEEVPQTRTVTDKDGNEIEIPYDVERVAPVIGAMGQMTAMLDCSGKIVAGAVQNFNDYFKQIFPEYVKANPNNYNTSNVEEIIASKAQVVYGPMRDEDMIAQLNAAGIAVVPLNTFSTVEEMKDNITKIAEILGGDAPEKAAMFCQYYQGNIDYVAEKTKDLSSEERVRIMTISYSGGAMSTINGSDICSVYMTAAGGINVAEDLEDGVKEISSEQIIGWNPEIIITYSETQKSDILAEPTLQTVDAVKNDKVYVVPYGTYMWSVRSGEGAMMPLWLAVTMHPDLFSDTDMHQVVREFYQTYYSYDVPEEEIAMILAGNQE